MQHKKHLFFDMDKTIAPARQPITQKMFDLLTSLEQDIIIVSGQSVEKIEWQSNKLPAVKLGQNGNEARDIEGGELWTFILSNNHKAEIQAHIEAITALLPESPNPEWVPVEDRGGQITFSPIGNVAPLEIKQTYDPDISKRFSLLKEVPFESDELVVKIGGSTSFDYFHKDGNKGSNVKKLIERSDWNFDDCIYYGDGLFPGGNDEAVIGVIETVLVESDEDTLDKLLQAFS